MRGRRIPLLMILPGLGVPALLLLLLRNASPDARTYSEFSARMREAEQRGRSQPVDNDKSRFFNGVGEIRKVVAGASVKELDSFVQRTARVPEGYDFVILYELIHRGDMPRIVKFLSRIDWGEPGQGDFWHQDVEWNLALWFPGKVPLEGLNALFDAAEATTNIEARNHLIVRIKFSLGQRALGGVQDADVIRVGRQWLTANRDQLELNIRYPAFMDSGGPFDGSRFGEPDAVYLLRMKGEPSTKNSEPNPPR